MKHRSYYIDRRGYRHLSSLSQLRASRRILKAEIDRYEEDFVDRYERARKFFEWANIMTTVFSRIEDISAMVRGIRDAFGWARSHGPRKEEQTAEESCEQSCGECCEEQEQCAEK